MWPDCASGDSSGARLNWTCFAASMSSPFATCTGLGKIGSCTSVQYFSALRAPKLPEAPLSKMAVACAAILLRLCGGTDVVNVILCFILLSTVPPRQVAGSQFL